MSTAKARQRTGVLQNDRVPPEVRAFVDTAGLVDFTWGRATYTDQEVDWAVKREQAEAEKRMALSEGESESKKKGNVFMKGLTAPVKILSRKDQTKASNTNQRRVSSRPAAKTKKEKDAARTDSEASVSLPDPGSFSSSSITAVYSRSIARSF